MEVFSLIHHCIHQFHNIEFVNSLLKEEYGHIADGLMFFGEDIFGNQFCFNEEGEIAFFNAETGEREVVAYDVTDWIDLLFEEVDYFTGYELLVQWKAKNKLDFNQRLSPKILFILGGEYAVSNLYSSSFPSYIKTTANIARQVYDLPDGTPFKLKID